MPTIWVVHIIQCGLSHFILHHHSELYTFTSGPHTINKNPIWPLYSMTPETNGTCLWLGIFWYLFHCPFPKDFQNLRPHLMWHIRNRVECDIYSQVPQLVIRCLAPVMMYEYISASVNLQDRWQVQWPGL